MMYDNDEDEYLNAREEKSRKISVDEEPYKKHKKSRKKMTTKQKVFLWIGRVSAVLAVTIAVFLVFVYGVMAVLCFGPSKTAKKQFFISVL